MNTITYNPLLTLEDLSKLGVKVKKITIVKTVYFDPETLEYNKSAIIKNIYVLNYWLTEGIINKINRWRGKIYWHPGNLSTFEECEEMGNLGGIKLRFL